MSLNLAKIGLSLIYAVCVVAALSIVFSVTDGGPFSHVLATIQEVDSILIGATVVGAPTIGYWIMKRAFSGGY